MIPVSARCPRLWRVIALTLPVSQAEKLRLLVEQEKKQLKGLDDEHTLELSEWKQRLVTRKEVSLAERRGWQRPRAPLQRGMGSRPSCATDPHPRSFPVLCLSVSSCTAGGQTPTCRAGAGAWELLQCCRDGGTMRVPQQSSRACSLLHTQHVPTSFGTIEPSNDTC